MPVTASATHPVLFRHHVPSYPLSEFVELIWYWSGHEVRYEKQRILPGATSALVINLGTGSTRGAGFSGPQSESFIIERTQQDELLGIHFKFGGMFPFLDSPLGEFHGVHLPIADIWGEGQASELICRLQEAPTVDLKFQVLEQWLLPPARLLQHHPAIAFAIKEFQRDSGLQSSAAMAERVGFSQRHFIQLFRDQVGLTPKLFSRVLRFQAIIKALEFRADVDWADVALSCGYFDQSHFNHEFKKFSGLSPTEYLALRTPYLSHILD